MGLVRCLASCATVAGLAGCGLNATGELPAGAAAGPDASSSRTRTPNDAATRDSHVGNADAHAADASEGAEGGHAVDASVEDVGSSEDGGQDGGHDAGHGGPCPTPPDCDNPACTAEGYACAPSPSGWTLAAVNFANASACPTGYTASAGLVTAPNSDPAVCSCACAVGTEPSCTTGSISGTYGGGGTSTTCGAGAYSLSANDGQCVTDLSTIEPLVRVSSFPAATGGTCSGTPMTQLPSDGSVPVYACTPSAAPTSTGCSAGNVCTATTAARTKCVMQAGPHSCPSGYGNEHDVGSGVTDGRDCSGPCTCGSITATCINQTWEFYGADNLVPCSGPATALVMDGSCDAQGAAAGTYGSYLFSADPQASCGPATASPSPTGSATLNGPETLCCE
jgi:hypothetical protein